MEKDYMEISLSKSSSKALVSKEDYDELIKYKWRLDQHGYACASINRNVILMHRFIMKPDENLKIDHINNVRLDNRRTNLRIVTFAQNNQNKKVSDSASSKYRGVYYVKNRNKYEARITINGERFNIGKYKTEIEAAEMVDKFVLYKNCEFINLNFPKKKQKYLDNPYIPKKKYENKTSKYYGVGKRQNKFHVFVVNNKKTINIGIYDDEIKAAKAFDEYVVGNNILDKKLNFPNNYPEYYADANKKIKTFYEENDEKTIKIILAKDEKVIIDKTDYDLVKHYTCCKSLDGYIKIIVNKKLLMLHRYLMGITDPNIFIDHINSNKSDNSRSNLRISNAKLNAQNKSKAKNSTSRYFGVNYRKNRKLWEYSIHKDGKVLVFGSNKNEEYVARKRDMYILTHLKNDNYKLNFEWSDADIKKWKEIFENKKKPTSKFNGVSYDNTRNRWRYTVLKKKKEVFRGFTDDEEYAAKIRDIYILTNLNKENYKLNFEWNNDDTLKWEKILDDENESRENRWSSKYRGIIYNRGKKSWIFNLIKNGKRIFGSSDKNEQIATRKRDLYILTFLKNDNYKLNFTWNEREISIWKKYFNAIGWNHLDT